MNNRQKTSKIIDLLIRDMSDRRGLGDEFGHIDDDIKEEIIETWHELILKVLENEAID